MGFKNRVFRSMLTAFLAVMFSVSNIKAEHIIGGDIYWECVTTGPDAGKFIFYLAMYKDCSVNTVISPSGHQLQLFNHPTMNGAAFDLTLISQTDVSPIACGLTCADELPYVSVEKYLFASDPVQITGVPPAQGYTIAYHRCCRNSVDNILNANTQEIYYTATMYPYNGQDVFPCYDSSPQFAELPTSLMCSGYQLRYNSNTIDTDLDSLSYEFVGALGNGGVPVSYQAGYSANVPMPGPTLDPTYDQITIDPVTGQIEYDSPSSIQGRWTVVAGVNGWRCGQLISKTIREMSVTIIPCTDPNSIPSASSPNWSAPASGSGYSVTVQAGDLVNFTLSAIDNDLTNGAPQIMEFTAAGSQFGTNFTNANAGCLNPPCATLSNVSPPSSSAGTISTTFNWQTTCDHVALNDECANLSTTYYFLFKYQDDFCPARGFNFVNVAVTVVGEPIVESPNPHCVSTAANGDITVYWEPSTDNNVPPSFYEYVIYHSTSPTGPFQEIGTVNNIATGTYVHTSTNPVAAPSTSGPNYYFIRTRSGCNDAVLDAPVDTVSSIYLTLNNTGETAVLNWTPQAAPPLPSSNGNGQGLYQIYREYPAGTWSQIGTTFGLTYTDPVIWCLEQVNYRIELTDDLPCTSVSNIVGDILNNPDEPAPQAIDSVSVDPITGFVTVCWSPSVSLNVTQYNVYINPDQFAWVPVGTVMGYNNTCWTDTNTDPSSQSLWYQVTATNNCAVEGLPAGSLIDNTDHHETILLEADYDSCLHQSTLTWNKYWYWQEGVKEYDVYASINAAPETKIGTVTDTFFVHSDMQISALYCYTVRAVKNVPQRITAASNQRCVFSYVPKRPDYQYHYNATVYPSNDGIETSFFVDSTAGYLGFEVQRGLQSDNLKYRWFIPLDPNTRYYTFEDNTARPRFNSYYYQIIGIDSCDLNADTMNMVRTVLLDAVANPDRTNDLSWNAYEGYLGNVVAYNIYRSVDDVYDFLNVVPGTTLAYTDTVEEIIIGEGNFCYYVEAVEGFGPFISPDGVRFQEKSRSNEACAPQHPNVFIPNAFVPEGVNNVLKPVTVFVDVDEYLFQIYNRWGQRIFETTDPNLGWTGNIGAEKAQQGAYAYFVKFVSAKGETFTKTGTVTLIR